MTRQPFLQDLLVCLHAPTQAWSAPDGQVRGSGMQGLVHADVRVLSRAVLTVGGEEPEVLAAGPEGAGTVRIVAVARSVDGPGADPTTRVERRRLVAPGRMTEEITLSCATAEPVVAEVSVTLASDMAPMDRVKYGAGTTADAPAPGPPARWTGPDGIGVRVDAPAAKVELTPDGAVLRWHVTVAATAPRTLTWTAHVTDTAAVVLPAPGPAEWSAPRVDAADRRLPGLVRQSLADLASLRLRSTLAPDSTFLAAGAPWFLTLFGRDSLWAGRMLLPLGTDLARGTLRTLGAAQGTRTDPRTAEQPGKILHELRRGELVIDARTVLPPLYYGTIDATPLWVCLLHDAWRWGMAEDDVAALLPHLQAALAWMGDHGDADGDGFLEYLDTSGTGLANQGWKDSGDAIQWRDGTLAAGTIALCEVQGYAHEAARGGAALLEAFGRPGADRWREWAARLAGRFRESFWVDDGAGPYPAVALDGAKRPVDSLTSNIGHLLGTGLLTAAEEELVVARLTGADMDSGYGLRTLSTRAGGYWPLRYHGGTVWPHDTAIAVMSMARAGFVTEALRLGTGLLEAAPHFGYRLPELFSGDARGTVPGPVPYPAACRPQAWSAAAAVALITAALGLRPDVPAGELHLRPAGGAVTEGLAVTGLRLAGHELSVEVGRARDVVVRTGADVRVVAT
ncbi:glycogen debranching N-terminal domain-containing protein [Georgenia yuyongxinii]|uniref:Amylo-alpha-1,6-glucosidase n=1 Tax=Georgenia yuyongxinii TaxID=2589797 RepID=A0A552WWH3_9MICO|nr:glycogen debranching N-terminal domain-containing protein [Georgenia yuyongxinii]TRW47132.1 amylo-alpha-1,6-glucosidase [Georgenia yuyongxinii]